MRKGNAGDVVVVASVSESVQRGLVKPILLAVPAVACAVSIAACGGGSKKATASSTSSAAPPATTRTQAPPSNGAVGSTVAIQADPSGALKFTTTQATAKAGKVTLKFANPAAVSHGLSIEGSGVNRNGQVVGQGGSTTMTVTLKPGKYTFYCPVPGHRQAGMQGTLTVQ